MTAGYLPSAELGYELLHPDGHFRLQHFIPSARDEEHWLVDLFAFESATTSANAPSQLM